MKKFFLAILILFISVSSSFAESRITLAELSGTVGVQMEEFVKEVIHDANESNNALIIFQLDTPGGLVSAMRGIVQSILSSRVPVAVWVPSGGRAASAGAFIVEAAHIAAMAPGTNIGAAHPVTAGGGNIESGDMDKKVVNDLKAQMRSVVQLRGRNESITADMIDESISLTANEALRERVIDIIAGDVSSLIQAVSGRRIKMGQNNFLTLEFDSEVKVLQARMSFSEQIIQFVSSPEIAYLLITGGIMAIFFEVITPGGFMLGTLGGVMFLLGAIGLKMLPFNWAGVVLIAAGLIIMAIDFIAGTMGVLILLGLPIFCLGGIFLFRAPGGELLSISLTVIMGIAIALAICFALVAFLVIKGFRRKITTGSQGMIGLEVNIISDISEFKSGQVICHGEIWQARTESGEFKSGESGIVKKLDGMTLIIAGK
ncbi:MAG: nodulation protein NfeD [Synergistaceae bacterium]|nr:nodulation protein NfeD [Synergistaceae bacterium]